MAFLPRDLRRSPPPVRSRPAPKTQRFAQFLSMTAPRTQVTGGRPIARSDLRVRLVGQLHGPAFGVLAGVDFEEAGAVVAADETILPAVELELAIRRAHEGF